MKVKGQEWLWGGHGVMLDVKHGMNESGKLFQCLKWKNQWVEAMIDYRLVQKGFTSDWDGSWGLLVKRGIEKNVKKFNQPWRKWLLFLECETHGGILQLVTSIGFVEL